MSLTQLADLENQVQKKWSPLFMPELKEMTVLPSLINRDYEGEITQGFDTVYVSQVITPTATRKNTRDADADTFESSKVQTRRIAIVADQTITAAHEFSSLAELQTQLGSPEGKSEIRRTLLKSMELELNNYIYSLVASSATAPDHVLANVSDFNAAQLLTNRKLASQAKWSRDEWWLLLDPSFFNDLLSAQTLTQMDSVGDGSSIVGGQFVSKRYGFNIIEDNSEGMKYVSPTLATEDLGLAFHKDFMHLVMQKQPTFELSSLHAQKKHGFLLSVNMVCGAAQGLQGDVKSIMNYNA